MKQLIKIWLILLILGISKLATATEISPTDWIILASPGCEGCQWLRESWLPETKSKLSYKMPKVWLVNIDKIKGYELLMNSEKILQVQGKDAPALLIGKKILYQEKEITPYTKTLLKTKSPPQMPKQLLALFKKSQLPIPYFATKIDTKTAQNSNNNKQSTTIHNYQKAEIIYFESPGCHKCARAEKQLQYFSQKFPNIAIIKINADDQNGRILQMALASKHKIPNAKRVQTPMFVSNKKILWGKNLTDKNLKQLFSTADKNCFWHNWNEKDELKTAKKRLQLMANEVTYPLLFMGALIDGINPCAFAVIIFLISYLTLTGGSGKKYALIFGLLFCLGVFICYFLLGIGLSKLLVYLQKYRLLFKWIILTMGGLSIILAILAFWDAWSAKKKGVAAMKFGMPKFITKIVHSLIRNSTGRSLLGLSALGLGIVVSSLELVCTGQVYLPMLSFINQVSFGINSVLMLAFYNFIFVLPLLLIVFLGVFGVKSKKIAGWAEKNAVKTRILMGVIILTIGIGLLWMGISS